MDYFQIGQRIKKFRKIKDMSQEQLAEKIDISTTHMSHIETGTTKLSLQVLTDIAQTLQITTDDLLFEEKKISNNELNRILSNCSTKQITILTPIIKELIKHI